MSEIGLASYLSLDFFFFFPNLPTVIPDCPIYFLVFCFFLFFSNLTVFLNFLFLLFCSENKLISTDFPTYPSIPNLRVNLSPHVSHFLILEGSKFKKKDKDLIFADIFIIIISFWL